MKKIALIVMITLFLVGVSSSDAFAQTTSQLQLGLSRDFGYGGFGNDIQGLFSLKINKPPQNLVKVDFYIDTSVIGEVNQAPFTFQFNTDTYSLGEHDLHAVGFLADGTQITSNTIRSNFVPAGAATGMITKILFPIVGLVVIMIVVAFALPLILNKGKLSALPLGASRNYGIGGGAICPKCGRPFPLRLWFINIGFSKIDRCPYCGKWSFVRPKSMAELRAAEQAELVQAQSTTPIIGETEAEKLKKEIDDSRYQEP